MVQSFGCLGLRSRRGQFGLATLRYENWGRYKHIHRRYPSRLRVSRSRTRRKRCGREIEVSVGFERLLVQIVRDVTLAHKWKSNTIPPAEMKSTDYSAIAEESLKGRDLNGSKDFAILTLETQPLLDSSD
ncbi:hypothetical protein L1049_019693 [Liquidambar formosana]|uniref:Uncharacterized protein n=1 Tax=Liquidambar formosana TaxID=63359 RepID=A0AAP0X9D5_LIQFO